MGEADAKLAVEILTRFQAVDFFHQLSDQLRTSTNSTATLPLENLGTILYRLAELDTSTTPEAFFARLKKGFKG